MRSRRKYPKCASCARQLGPMEVGPPAGWLNVYAASSGVSTITIMAALPFSKPHHDIDQLSIRWLWITLWSPAARWIGWYDLGQSRGSSVPLSLESTV